VADRPYSSILSSRERDNLANFNSFHLLLPLNLDAPGQVLDYFEDDDYDKVTVKVQCFLRFSCSWF